MTVLHLDVRAGATAAALLGVLVELGASIQRIEQAVATLGDGPVRLTVSGGRAGSEIRVRAPEGSLYAETWGALRPRVALLATEEAIAHGAVALLDALFTARGAVHRVPPDEVDIDPFSGLDDLAAALGLAAALVDLAPEEVTASAVGLGTGTLDTIEGPIALPGPVVAALLADRPTLQIPVDLELVDPVGAAFLAALTSHAEAPDEAVTTTGRGRLPGRGARTSTLVGQMLLSVGGA